MENEQSLSPKEKEVIQALRKTKFGAIEITIHNSEIVQIERKEKIRFDKQTTA